MFQRFYRAETARRISGNGLRLSSVAAIAKLHNATVTARTLPQGGGRFDIARPAVEAG